MEVYRILVGVLNSPLQLEAQRLVVTAYRRCRLASATADEILLDMASGVTTVSAFYVSVIAVQHK